MFQLRQSVILNFLGILLLIIRPSASDPVAGSSSSSIGTGEKYPIILPGLVPTSPIVEEIKKKFNNFLLLVANKDANKADSKKNNHMEDFVNEMLGVQTYPINQATFNYENFIKMTVVTYLAAEYIYSNILCRVNYTSGGPLARIPYVRPVTSDYLQSCRKVTQWLYHITQAYFVAMKGDNKRAKIRLMRNLDQILPSEHYNQNNEYYAFLTIVFQLTNYIGMLNDASHVCDKYETSKKGPRLYREIFPAVFTDDNLFTYKKYLRKCFAKINIDKGPLGLGLPGSVVPDPETGIINIEHEESKITYEWFLWRNGIEILRLADADQYDVTSTEGFNPFMFLAYNEYYRNHLNFELRGQIPVVMRSGQVIPPIHFTYPAISVHWNPQDVTKPNVKFVVQD